MILAESLQKQILTAWVLHVVKLKESVLMIYEGGP